MIRFATVAILFLSTTRGFSQTVLEIPLQKVKTQSLTELLLEFEGQQHVRMFFMEDWLSGYEVGPHFDGYTLKKILDETLESSGIAYDFMFGYALIFHKDPRAAIERADILNRAAVQRTAVESWVIGSKSKNKPGRKLVLSLTIHDQDTDKPLEGTSVLLNERSETHTGLSGQCEFLLLPGSYVLTIRRNQYDDKIVDLEIYESGHIEIELQETPILLSEVVISEEMLLDKSIGKIDINMSQVKRAPVFLGEVDVIKQVQSQPGVTTVGEVASGFNVRGGSVDQNLVLYDDVPIFNTSHALGFFTAFNPEAIGDVAFYRGGIPAQYGGRVASVLSIASKEGNPEKWTGGGGIGIISSHVTAGGPVKQDTTSVQVSVRSTYSNWMLQAIKSNYKNVSNTSVNFYDASMNLNHRFTERSKLTFSVYKSNDRFSLTGDTAFHWANTAAALRFDHVINEKLFSSTALTYGKYNFKVSDPEPATAFDLTYSISYPSLKVDFHLDGPHRLAFGFQTTWYRFDPGKLMPSSVLSNVPERRLDAEKSLESALYLSDGFNLSEKLFVEAGIRLSLFNRFGPGTVYKYRSDLPREVRNIRDSVVYGPNDVSQTYMAAEPRFSLRYSVGQNTSFKFGYHRMVQYMHLITNTAAIMPTDIWQSSNTYFKPQISDQLSAGVFRTFSDQMFETFVEAYLKRVRNTLDFKDGADLILNSHLETALISTTGNSYGAEFSVSKIRGRLQGAVNYTYSRSFRQGYSPFDSEKINLGRQYAANHDQPHVANLNWRYAFSRRIYFSGNFVYHTGRPVSMPGTTYKVDGIPVSDFSERNQLRIPDYHRFDMAVIVESNHKRKKPWSGHWIFSFYNVYGRRNAYSVFFADDGNGVLKPYRLSVIGTVIPSISYSFKF